MTYGVVMMTSASGMCLSKVEFSPSLSEVVTSSWPWEVIHSLRPSSFSVQPRRRGSLEWTGPAYHDKRQSANVLQRSKGRRGLHRRGRGGPCPAEGQRRTERGPGWQSCEPQRARGGRAARRSERRPW